MNITTRFKQLIGWKGFALLPILTRLLLSGTVAGQTPSKVSTPDALHQLNDSIEALVQRVSPAVVQIQVTGYRPAPDSSQGEASIVGKRRSVGSGVIVDPDGYIVTNAHVVDGAEKIEVVSSFMVAEGRVIGVAPEIDLAVIKIEAHGLSSLSIQNSVTSRQGELVFAFGSPEGLHNTVTMGVVSSVARQLDPDSPFAYVQTDAPINPGNSGGPLVDADGKLIGINTFILSASGGSQGLGFAIPSSEIAFAYPQLLKYGHIHQPEIGAILQGITPELAAALHLERDFGVIVADILPGGPADSAGLKTGDIILGVDGTPTAVLPVFRNTLYKHESGECAKFEVLRGSQRLQLEIPLVERPYKADGLAEIADPEKDLIQQLDIFGIDLKPDLARSLPNLRIATGVMVGAKTQPTGTEEIPLQTGDVIHALNGATITNLAELRAELAKLKPGDPVALRVERYTQLIYVSFLL